MRTPRWSRRQYANSSRGTGKPGAEVQPTRIERWLPDMRAGAGLGKRNPLMREDRRRIPFPATGVACGPSQDAIRTPLRNEQRHTVSCRGKLTSTFVQLTE